ncbi:hypothetical protein RRU94_15410 [Domibacillus sp. DTU_2020_1001157_1_SI_ALB_TIR_016]|uniref:hypothetical protein n=1 Tax=Domibacillus sp. DTU_2020_1001157_1_SI_ALB_TIR_016 TaxID=3077789 RepID=UPI0028ED8860|nr:hypothetical protein [Domibacillus sp. DTU_2020_1001157_1_SI_ALB_TIR_016]WNS82138.1 hypothetical protein RRU94_15410 [Domibacillus sp. DTU_2020_1001157_1_SI_ALB_TIR_016]
MRFFFLAFYSLLICFAANGLFVHPANAASVVKGTFVEAVYEYVQIDDETSEKRLTGVIIQNDQGKTATWAIDSTAALSVNSIGVTIDAFKTGMAIEATVNLRRIKSMSGKSYEAPGAIDTRDRAVTGTINRIDPNGEFLSIRFDNGQTKTYYLNGQTEVYKGTTLVDLSVLYEGDRVKLTFSSYNTSYIQSIDVNTQGIKIERLVKGTIQAIDPIRRKLTIKNETTFKDWKWDDKLPRQTSYTYTAKTPIYIGNQPIAIDKARYYQNNEAYFVTVRQFNKEVVERIVIRKNNERTFYEPLSSVTLAQKKLTLQKSGSVSYHTGTILIRNGRIVDPNSLPFKGAAFVATDGRQKSEYANVIHIMNDGFESPNLVNHALYFGRIHWTNGYQLTLSNAQKLLENRWTSVLSPSLAFSNDTAAVHDFGSGVLKIVPQQDEVREHLGSYGYFYVADGHIVGMHLVGKDKAPLISVGRLEKITYEASKDDPEKMEPIKIDVRNVSRIVNGAWDEAGQIKNMDIQQTTFIRDGHMISADELNIHDRLYIVHESVVKGRIILVN